MRALRLPALLVLIAVALLATYYAVYVRDKEAYLTGRNLRVIASLGNRLEAALEDHETVLTSFSTYFGPYFATGPGFQCVGGMALGSAAVFEYVVLESGGGTFAPTAGVPCEPPATTDGRKGADPGPPAVIFNERRAGVSWTRHGRAADATGQLARLQVTLDEVFDRLLRDHARSSVFDAIALATASGRVMHLQTGSGLRLNSLSRLTVHDPDGNRRPLDFATLPSASQVHEVELSGARYYLYLQPCCGDVAGTGQGDGTGWLVAGLMDAAAFRSAKISVSFSMMALMALALLMAIFSWPFLKLALIREGQRLRLVDVLLVGVCGVLGIAVITMFAVDWYAYGKLRYEVDRQLAQLSDDVTTAMEQEIEAANTQLDRLEAWASGYGPRDRIPRLFDQFTDVTYPFFESFALIDRAGQQRRKWSVGDFTTPLISTRRRAYFRHWVEGGTDYPSYMLEAIRSGTTARKQAVLSKPVRRAARGATDDGLAVAALTIPMVALTDPVLPPGFSFAVIDDRGQVLFHSDAGHMLDEHLFLETDRERRLRAAVAARRAELMNLRYFGRDHRAYVAPVTIPEGANWSVVTLFDKELVRTINIEWLVITLLFTVIYVGLYLLLCGLVLLARPDYRAPWIWPDPAREPLYQQLLLSYLVFATAFAIAIYHFRDSYLLAVAFLLPFVVWSGTYLLLHRRGRPWRTRNYITLAVGLVISLLLFLVLREEAGRGFAVALVVLGAFALLHSGLRLPVRHAYQVAGALLLVLTVVMPALAFFKIAHAIQVESFIKHGQLTFARELQRRGDLARQQYQALEARKRGQIAADLRKLRERLTLYDEFFFSTTAWVQGGVSGCDPRSATTAGPQDARSELPKAIENLLPYYSEASVAMRELLHDRASDEGWTWTRSRSHLMMETQQRASEGRVCVASNVPSAYAMGSGGGRETMGNAMRMGTLALLPLFSVVGLVRFVSRRVFLIDVVEPIATRGAARGRIHSGAQAFLLWPSEDRGGRALDAAGACIVDFAERIAPGPTGDAFAVQRERLDRCAATDVIVFDRLEHRLSSARFNTRKLTLINETLEGQHRAVVLVSTLSPGMLVRRIAAAAGADAAAVAGIWRSTLARFTVIDATRLEDVQAPIAEAVAAAEAAPAPAAKPAASAAPAFFGAAANDLDGLDAVGRSIWKEVAAAQPPLERDQIYEEIGDRLGGYYEGIWSTCTPTEQLVLQQLAQEGLINEKDRRSIRRLLGRGLIRKSPNFRLMNEPFRRFARSRPITSDGIELEKATGSTWDAIRLPFLAILVFTSAFFFLTQRELFTTTMAVVTALAGGIPAVLRLVGLFERRPAGGE